MAPTPPASPAIMGDEHGGGGMAAAAAAARESRGSCGLVEEDAAGSLMQLMRRSSAASGGSRRGGHHGGAEDDGNHHCDPDDDTQLQDALGMGLGLGLQPSPRGGPGGGASRTVSGLRWSGQGLVERGAGGSFSRLHTGSSVCGGAGEADGEEERAGGAGRATPGLYDSAEVDVEAVQRQQAPAACESLSHVVYKQWHPAVSVLFADICGYTSLSQQLEPEQVMSLLHELYSKYDALCAQYGVYKVETIGDCFMAATGLLVETPEHARQAVEFGKAMLRAARTVRNPLGGVGISVRVGIHSGRVMSGIVGTLRARYCLFGDAVNTASRMESTGLPGCIQISEVTYQTLTGSGGDLISAPGSGLGGGGAWAAAAAAAAAQQGTLWDADVWEERGMVEVKGKGTMRTFLLRGDSPAE